MSRILVLGSKADPVIPNKNYEKVYFINGSIRYKKELKKIKYDESIHILTSSNLFNESEVVKITQNFIKGSEVDKLIILNYNDYSEELLHNKILEFRMKFKKIEFYSPLEFESLTIGVHKKKFYLNFILNIFNKKTLLKDKIDALKSYLRGILHLSTGFYAIFHALKETNEVTVAGIGIIGGGYTYYKQKYRDHAYKDYVAIGVLKTLKRNINFTDPIVRNIYSCN
jgi:hypothetical protein